MRNNNQLIEDAREIISMWKNGQHDNFKDVITEFNEVIAKLPKKETEVISELNQVVIEIVAELEKSASDPAFVKQNLLWIDPTNLNEETYKKYSNLYNMVK